MTKPIHTCEFESGRCKLCGVLERTHPAHRKTNFEYHESQRGIEITREQMDRLIHEFGSLNWTLFVIGFLLVIITITLMFK